MAWDRTGRPHISLSCQTRLRSDRGQGRHFAECDIRSCFTEVQSACTASRSLRCRHRPTSLQVVDGLLPEARLSILVKRVNRRFFKEPYAQISYLSGTHIGDRSPPCNGQCQGLPQGGCRRRCCGSCRWSSWQRSTPPRRAGAQSRTRRPSDRCTDVQVSDSDRLRRSTVTIELTSSGGSLKTSAVRAANIPRFNVNQCKAGARFHRRFV